MATILRRRAAGLGASLCSGLAHLPAVEPPIGGPARTRVSIVGTAWHINGSPVNPGSPAAGLLMNVRMVNAIFEDRNRSDFDADANADRFIAAIPAYAAHGVNAFTVCLQGGMPG